MNTCGAVSNRSRISIIDNYKTQLQFSRPSNWNNDYITIRAREIDETNNVSNSTSISSDGVCIG